MITTDTPTAEHFAAITGWEIAKAQHVIDAGTLFVCSYNDDDLDGVLWYVGTGVDWWTTGIIVVPSARAKQVGTLLRQTMIAECEAATFGSGFIRGVYRKDINSFWESVPGTHVNKRLMVGERKI